MLQNHPVIDKVYAKGTAYAPHTATDKLFMLENGSHHFSGILGNSIRIIVERQLLDTELWKLFVNQFRKGDTDDHNLGWRCEYWGKMIRGACMIYQCSPDEKLYSVIRETILDMLSTQDSLGRFSTYSKEKELDGWDLWGRKYILLGMQHFLEICDDPQLCSRVIEALRRHLDAILDTVGPAEENKKEILDASRHWQGLNSSSLLEPVMRMYNITGEERYLDFAHYIVSRGGIKEANLFELAYEGKLAPYEYPVTKAYEMISNFEGLLEYYRVTGEEKWRIACVHLGEKIAETDITLIGCAGCTHELFDHSAVRQFDAEEKGIMQETCVTVTWMKFCWQLLCLTGDSIWADRMEWSLYNALLGSINTDQVQVNNGLPFDSYSPLLPGTRGRLTGGYQQMENGTCYGCCACIGAAGLGIAGIAETVCAHDGVYLNFYLPGKVSTRTPAGNPLVIFTSTKYPVQENVQIKFGLEKPERFVAGVRIPKWCRNASVRVNGNDVPCVSGSYLCMDREWKNGDEIELVLDLNTYVITPECFGVSSSDAPYTALHRGPLVLARDERLGQHVDSPVSLNLLEDGSVQTILNSEQNFDCNIGVNVCQRDGTVLPLVDYASAGKTWTEESRMCAWMKRSEMLDAQKYIDDLSEKLLEAFGSRLAYVGLQGSYMREEATENSDIDPMVVIDGLTVEDLKTYREIVNRLPDPEKSCGFICGKKELAQWNPLEIFHLLHATKDCFGRLETLVPEYSQKDATDYIRFSLNGLSHAMCHSLIHSSSEKNEQKLSGSYKAAFFILQDLHCLRTGTFINSCAKLAQVLEGRERFILEKYISFKLGDPCNFEEDFKILFDWCTETMSVL